MHVRIMVGCVLVLGVVATGCCKKKQEAEDAAAARIASKAISLASGKDVKVQVDGDTVTFTDEEGGVRIHGGKGAKLPTGFPDDLPIYKKSEILQTASTSQDEFMVSIQTRDAGSRILALAARAGLRWRRRTAIAT